MNNVLGIAITISIFIIPIALLFKTDSKTGTAFMNIIIINWMLLCYGMLCVVSQLVPSYGKWFFSIYIR